MAWANEQARLSGKLMDYHMQKLFTAATFSSSRFTMALRWFRLFRGYYKQYLIA